HAPGRYAFHDLLRAYAAYLARTTDGELERQAAGRRGLDHSLHTPPAARPQLPLGPPSAGVTPETLSTVAEVLAWFEAERQVLIAAITQAADAGLDAHAW